jgi:hypothetical protein
VELAGNIIKMVEMESRLMSSTIPSVKPDDQFGHSQNYREINILRQRGSHPYELLFYREASGTYK